jgi:sugar O-acyltransferase (sialic acid O-acetyltransferase NeuD family)
MEKQELILVGGGGHCKSCIEVIESTGTFIIKGILDKKEKVGTKLCGYDILGTDDDIPQYINQKTLFFITVGHLKSADLRMEIAQKIADFGGELASVVSSSAFLSKRSSIGKGTILMNGAKVNADVSIGDNTIINTDANIEHDCVVENFVHISTGAVVNGECIVKSETFVGSNSVLVNGISVGKNVLIGAGTVVNQTIDIAGTYVGNPCRRLKNKT